MKRKITSLIIAVVLISTLFAGVIIASDQEKPSDDVRKAVEIKDDQRTTDYRSKEVGLKLDQSRERVISQLRDELVGIDDWDLIDLFDIDVDFTNDLSKKEAYHFLGVIIELQRDILKKGDLIPAMLLNKEKDKAYFVWERVDGKVAYMNVDKSASDETWSLGELIEK